MLVKEIKSNLKKRNDLAQYKKEIVTIENEALAKRIHHLKTDQGTEISIRLEPGKHLHVGDILLEEEQRVIVVEVLPEDVLVIKPQSIHEMGVIAHELGNRHLPAQFIQNEMLVQYDYLVEHLLTHKNIAYSREQVKLPEAFRHIGHSHDE